MLDKAIPRASDRRVLERLFACSSELTACGNLEVALGLIAETLIEVSGADFGSLQLIDEKSGELDLVLAPGFDKAFQQLFQVVTANDHSACGRALRHQHPIYIPDVRQDEAFAPLRPMAEKHGFRAVLSFPLTTASGAPVGIVSVYFRDAGAAGGLAGDENLLRFVTLAAGTIRNLQDLTALERSEREQGILLRELNHRARNMLTVLRASERFVPPDTDPKEAGETLTGRLMAIANTQLLLTEGGMDADLGSMIRQQLALGSSFDSRVDCSGPQITLPVDHAFRLSLVVHELSTNAQKHGALSDDRGRLEIEWRIDPSQGLELNWTEKDGPAVTPPKKDGFGMTLVRNVFSSDPDSDVDLRFAPSGLLCTVRLALSRHDTARTGLL